MIEIQGFDAVVCCDSCLKELAFGRYPADAMDNLGPENWVVSGEGERNDEVYCNECYHEFEGLDQLPENIEPVKKQKP